MLRGLLLLIVTPLLVVSVAGNLLLFKQGQSTSEEAAHLRQRAIQAEQALNSQTTALQSQPQSTAGSGLNSPAVAAPAPSLSASPPLAGAGLVDTVLSEVQALRGLRPTASVPVKFLDEAALKTILMRRFEQDYLPTEREVDQKLLVMLGLLRPDQDLVGIDRDLLTDQVLGLYSTDDNTLYVLGDP